MSIELKLKLKQAAETAWEQDTRHNPNPCNPYAYVYGYKAGAQTILENPSEWGLVPKDEFDLAESNYDFFHVKCAEAESQLTKYREALERLLEENMCSHAGDELIEEALKQEE